MFQNFGLLADRSLFPTRRPNQPSGPTLRLHQGLGLAQPSAGDAGPVTRAKNTAGDAAQSEREPVAPVNAISLDFAVWWSLSNPVPGRTYTHPRSSLACERARCPNLPLRQVYTGGLSAGS